MSSETSQKAKITSTQVQPVFQWQKSARIDLI